MKEIATHLSNPNSWLYRSLNALLVGIVIFSFTTILQLSFRETSDYFTYNSITPTQMVYQQNEPLEFVSSITRKKETDMRFNDTLFCGFFANDLFWYSQDLGEYNNAPAGEFKSRWIYQGERPTTPMICQLQSAPYVSLPFGIDTDPQRIITNKFYLE